MVRTGEVTQAGFDAAMSALGLVKLQSQRSVSHNILRWWSQLDKQESA